MDAQGSYWPTVAWSDWVGVNRAQISIAILNTDRNGRFAMQWHWVRIFASRGLNLKVIVSEQRAISRTTMCLKCFSGRWVKLNWRSRRVRWKAILLAWWCRVCGYEAVFSFQPLERQVWPLTFPIICCFFFLIHQLKVDKCFKTIQENQAMFVAGYEANHLYSIQKW